MAPKPIRISGHARFEMRRRGVSQADVLRIYQNLVGPGRRFLLRVAVKEDADAYHVVTAYKTSKIAKYWKNS